MAELTFKGFLPMEEKPKNLGIFTDTDEKVK